MILQSILSLNTGGYSPRTSGASWTWVTAWFWIEEARDTLGSLTDTSEMPRATFNLSLKFYILRRQMNSITCLLQCWLRKACGPPAPVNTCALYWCDPCSCSFQLAQGQSWHLPTETIPHKEVPLCIHTGILPATLSFCPFYQPVSLGARSCWTFKSLKTKGVLQFHLMVLFNFPSETPFSLCISIFFFKLLSLPFYLHTNRHSEWHLF